ncbi:hypothetical protein EVAR_20976_1 [Eumeta japonica]|uniref:Uncharacterized protein n=1 Tax=Eumeta variegata TaxID=151549 RepID=A0A4C1V7Z8_EUMVA|nr:hypothetical protein EVAR_20976_1 [Eumeta japonica]
MLSLRLPYKGVVWYLVAPPATRGSAPIGTGLWTGKSIWANGGLTLVLRSGRSSEREPTIIDSFTRRSPLSVPHSLDRFQSKTNTVVHAPVQCRRPVDRHSYARRFICMLVIADIERDAREGR